MEVPVDKTLHALGGSASRAISTARGAYAIGSAAEAVYNEPARNLREMWLMAQ